MSSNLTPSVFIEIKNEKTMKTILVDAVQVFIIKGEGIFKEMYDLLETFPNKKIILTGANDEQFKTLNF
ncbi:MAG: hypothetical protein A2355_04500 [Spirochaetes bacterium RIFOXYB1_FULL_32_8]|nr:MAG: hypothetical protein A2355_04500 [Spirochaetes bacterium RIFOXYB1_FULL_32_8]